ncbi:MAG TPA: hypothetical protein VM677_34945 [Actinokineospora sp.]|nr:hypothetical protein [Actinokineospora sp.]
MNRAKKFKAVLAGAIVAGGTVAAFLLPGTAAVADQSGSLSLSVTVEPNATLLARGAAADVQIEFTCNSGGSAYLSVELTQRAGGKEVATGYGSTQVGCTGQPQRTIMSVTANGNVFSKGEAFAAAGISSCGVMGCGNAYDERVIQLNR